jgi:LAO/AO transport system kinase
MIDSLLERFHRGDRLALTRLLTLLTRGEGTERILASIEPTSPTSRVVAFTGSGGVGKSTLIGKLIQHVRSQGKTVAVLACDPRSPATGGALLGDRVRMAGQPDDDGVFIRSIATESRRGAVTENLPALIRLLEAFGFELVIVETVGAGQGDTAAADVADVFVLLIQPEMGDELQWEKAGVLELADIVVVNKADLPGAEATETQVRSSLILPGSRPVTIVRASAKNNEGIASLWQAIAGQPLRRKER